MCSRHAYNAGESNIYNCMLWAQADQASSIIIIARSCRRRLEHRWVITLALCAIASTIAMCWTSSTRAIALALGATQHQCGRSSRADTRRCVPVALPVQVVASQHRHRQRSRSSGRKAMRPICKTQKRKRFCLGMVWIWACHGRRVIVHHWRRHQSCMASNCRRHRCMAYNCRFRTSTSTSKSTSATASAAPSATLSLRHRRATK